jgi:hypothetical protein
VLWLGALGSLGAAILALGVETRQLRHWPRPFTNATNWDKGGGGGGVSPTANAAQNIISFDGHGTSLPTHLRRGLLGHLQGSEE